MSIKETIRNLESLMIRLQRRAEDFREAAGKLNTPESIELIEEWGKVKDVHERLLLLDQSIDIGNSTLQDNISKDIKERISSRLESDIEDAQKTIKRASRVGNKATQLLDRIQIVAKPKVSPRLYEAKIKAYEAKYAKKLESDSKIIYNKFTSDLKKEGLQAAKSNLSNQLINEQLADTLQDIYTKVGLEGAKFTNSQLSQVKGALRVSGGFGRNEQWIANVLQYLRLNILDFASRITETIKSDILKVIEKGIDEGWGIDKMVQYLQTSTLPRVRAARIARTEVNRASNVGHSEGAKSFPYEVNKKWSAAKDHRTRHSHRQVNNHVTDEQGTFRVPVYRGDTPTGEVDVMQRPGDPDAHASNTINCRCRITHVPKRDAKGNLIRRERGQAPVISMGQVGRGSGIGIAAIRKAIINSISINVEA
jgi:hypothetical protein